MLPEVLEPAGLSALAVAAAEIGDKTWLLALVLAARCRAPLTILLGILAATLANHAMAGFLGVSVAAFMAPGVLRWVLAASFLAMAVWMLLPGKIDDESLEERGSLGVFAAACVLFFLAEMGDRTQLATVAMAAHWKAAIPVIIGSTLGMLAADLPAVLVGDRLPGWLSPRVLKVLSALIFAGFAAAAFFATPAS